MSSQMLRSFLLANVKSCGICLYTVLWDNFTDEQCNSEQQADKCFTSSYNLLCWLFCSIEICKILWGFLITRTLNGVRQRSPQSEDGLTFCVFQTPSCVVLQWPWWCQDIVLTTAAYVGRSELPFRALLIWHHKHWRLPEVLLFLFRSVWEKGTKPNRESDADFKMESRFKENRQSLHNIIQMLRFLSIYLIN